VPTFSYNSLHAECTHIQKKPNKHICHFYYYFKTKFKQIKSITPNLTSGKSNKKRFGLFVIQETNDGCKERNNFELLNPGD